MKAMPELTEKLRKLVLERSRLFLHNNTEEVLHDARWLENNLKVEIVDSIRLRRTLKNEGSRQLTHQDTKTAAVTSDTKTKWWILFLTPKYEFYDVSQALVHVILRKPRPHSSLLLDSLLNNGESNFILYYWGRTENWEANDLILSGYRLDDA